VARSHPQHGLHVASDAGISQIRRSGGAAPWQAAQSPHAMAATCARFIASSAKTRRRHIPIPREIHQRSTKVDSFSGSQPTTTSSGPLQYCAASKVGVASSVAPAPGIEVP